MSGNDCIFCAITSGAIPAEIVESTDTIVAFRDIAPKADVHVLIVPREHHANVVDLAAANPELLADMAAMAGRVADAQCNGEFRWVFNTGPRAGQSVFHVHGHLLGGSELPWGDA